MVFGQGVADDETFCALMEENWTQSGVKVVVGNGGRTGSGIRDQQAPLRRLLPEFEPDLVVSCIYMGNDFIDNLSDRTVVDGFPLAGSEASLARESWRFRLTYSSFVAFEVESFLFKHLPSLAVTIPSPADSVLPPPLKGSMAVYTEGFFMDRIAPLPPHVQTLWSLTETHIRELRDLAAPTPLAVVIIPTSLHVIPDHYEKFRDRDDVNLDPKQHRRGEAQRRFVEMGKKLGIPVFDLTPLLEKGPDQAADWLPTDRHFSIHGHRRVAQWLQPWLDAM